MAVESLQERSRGTLLSPPTRDEEGQPSSCPAVETATYPRTIGFRSEHGRARESILYIYIYIHIKREREGARESQRIMVRVRSEGKEENFVGCQRGFSE